MARNGPFKGRSVGVVRDLSIDEQRYLYRKARELKAELGTGGDARRFRIADPDYSAYLVFLENSTRTRESFRNAALFHRVRATMFDAASSSFAKNESLTDAIKMLIGYAPESAFVIRSGLEGVCAWLADYLGPWAERMGYPRPSFINAGDGKHEHPTQEFLDEFSFLEQAGWDESALHIALVGDLRHGRTAHSKADGLGIFGEVEVDLVAPPELSMPEDYVERMRLNGFELRTYESIDEYLDSGRVAPSWYFTRLQLERMGDTILDKAPALRKAVTFRRDMAARLPESTRFYHPLPRDRLAPTIPSFLDDTPLNGWDAQSANGYYTRAVLLGMLSGLLGADFDGQALEPREAEAGTEFVVEAPVSTRVKPEYKVGIKPVESGLVIDHIAAGKPIEEIWGRIDKIRRVLGLNVRSSHGVYHSNSGDYKGIISVPDLLSFGEKQLKRLASVSPGCTLNLVKDGHVAKKYRLGMPPLVYNFDDISCRNELCVSHPSHAEHVGASFVRKPGSTDTFVCRWCEREHGYDDIWRL